MADGQVPERRKSKMNETASLPPGKKKKWFWRLLIGGVAGFGLVCLGLIAISLPNLTREVVPPVISGPRQLEKVEQSREMSHSDENRETPSTDDTPTSRTIIVDAAGQEILNLRDFPHLSPTMRYLAEEWIVAWKELEEAIGANTGSATPSQIRQKLLQSVEDFKACLNLPLEWGKMSYQETYDKLIENLESDAFRNGMHNDFRDGTESSLAVLRVLRKLDVVRGNMTSRVRSELAIQYGEWGEAVRASSEINTYREYQRPYDSRPVIEQCREDELFCWRQMGLTGRIGLVARSYEERLPRVQKPSLTNDLAHLPAEFVWGAMSEGGLWQKTWNPPQNPEEPTQTAP